MNKKDNLVKKPYALIGQKAVLFNTKGEILLLRRSAKTPRPGGWDFPGGGLDKGEEPVSGIVREIREETGLEASDIKPVQITSHMEGENYVVLIWYRGGASSSDVELSDEHDACSWLTIKKALLMDIPERMKTVIRQCA